MPAVRFLSCLLVANGTPSDTLRTRFPTSPFHKGG